MTDCATTADLAHSLRAMHAAALPCGTSEDGRIILSIHADARRLADLLAAAERLEDLEQAVRHEADLAQQAMDAMHFGIQQTGA